LKVEVVQRSKMKNLLLPNRNFLSGLNLFLSILGNYEPLSIRFNLKFASLTVDNYLNQSYCGCLIKRGHDIGDFHFGIRLPILTIEYEEESFEDHLLGCIESACPTFFVMAGFWSFTTAF
jgi:hypothetical protein